MPPSFMATKPRKPLPSWPAASRFFKAFRVGADFRFGLSMNTPRLLPFCLTPLTQANMVYRPHHGWDVARRAAVGRPFIFSGCLNAENVAAAVRIVRLTPWMSPVAVESKPGKKDHGRLREFIRKSAAATEIESSSGRFTKSMSSILQSPTTAPGRFVPTAGRYVPETLMVPLSNLSAPTNSRSRIHCSNALPRPSKISPAARHRCSSLRGLTERLGGPRIISSGRSPPHWRA